MKEWTAEEALSKITNILLDNLPEEHVSDQDCDKIAELIVRMLEESPKS